MLVVLSKTVKLRDGVELGPKRKRKRAVEPQGLRGAGSGGAEEERRRGGEEGKKAGKGEEARKKKRRGAVVRIQV